MVNKESVAKRKKLNNSSIAKTKNISTENDAVEELNSLPEVKKTPTKKPRQTTSDGSTKVEASEGSDFPIPERPKNTVMPEDYSSLSFPEILKTDKKDVIKLCTFNVASLKAASKKGLLKYVEAENPEILCLQETKLQNAPETDQYFTKALFPFQAWWCSTSKKGYSGTAVLSKIKPISHFFGFKAKPDLDDEGRVITVEFTDFYLVNVYVPNAGDKLVRLEYRLKWDQTMKEHLISLETTGKPVIYTGDLNVAHYPIDIARPKQNLRSAGFTQEERDSFTSQLQGDDTGNHSRIDIDRHFHPNEPARYTYHSFRFGARSKGIGWRLDYFVVSSSLLPKMIASDIRFECYGASDHLPSVLWFKSETPLLPKDEAHPKKAQRDITSFFKPKNKS